MIRLLASAFLFCTASKPSAMNAYFSAVIFLHFLAEYYFVGVGFAYVPTIRLGTDSVIYMMFDVSSSLMS
jgi:hypothetical protein